MKKQRARGNTRSNAGKRLSNIEVFRMTVGCSQDFLALVLDCTQSAIALAERNNKPVPRRSKPLFEILRRAAYAVRDEDKSMPAQQVDEAEEMLKSRMISAQIALLDLGKELRKLEKNFHDALKSLNVATNMKPEIPAEALERYELFNKMIKTLANVKVEENSLQKQFLLRIRIKEKEAELAEVVRLLETLD